jgi:glucose uptake protein
MILPETYAATMLLMILSLVCLGIWVSTLKLAGKWRFELYYFDFVFGLLVTALILAFTLGNLGYDGFDFLDDLQHAGKRQWVFCFAAGMIFNLANLLLVAAVSVAGTVLAFPVGMGIGLILGTLLNFATSRSGNGAMILAGAVLVLVSALVNAIGHGLLAVERHEELARAGKAKSTRRPSGAMGIVLSLVSGLLMGSFWPLLDKARLGDVGMGPYAMGVVFALGVFFSTFVYNIFLMNLPVAGDPLDLSAYIAGKLKQHIWGLLGGAIWCLGTVAGMVVLATPEAQQGSPALRAILGQAAPLLTALVGIFVWRELKGGDMRVRSLTLLMLVLYGCGVVLLSIAPIYVRKA